MVEGQRILDDENCFIKEKQLKRVYASLLDEYDGARNGINRISEETPGSYEYGLAAGIRYAFEPDETHPACRPDDAYFGRALYWSPGMQAPAYSSLPAMPHPQAIHRVQSTCLPLCPRPMTQSIFHARLSKR